MWLIRCALALGDRLPRLLAKTLSLTGISTTPFQTNPCRCFRCTPVTLHTIIITMVAAENWKGQALPLARIKKIMKSEEAIYQEMERERQVQQAASSGAPAPAQGPTTRFMIAGEAPVLLGKACELLIKELTVRAWRHTERNRRRTLQRQDVHAAVGESEV